MKSAQSVSLKTFRKRHDHSSTTEQHLEGTQHSHVQSARDTCTTPSSPYSVATDLIAPTDTGQARIQRLAEKVQTQHPQRTPNRTARPESVATLEVPANKPSSVRIQATPRPHGVVQARHKAS